MSRFVEPGALAGLGGVPLDSWQSRRFLGNEAVAQATMTWIGLSLMAIAVGMVAMVTLVGLLLLAVLVLAESFDW